MSQIEASTSENGTYDDGKKQKPQQQKRQWAQKEQMTNGGAAQENGSKSQQSVKGEKKKRGEKPADISLEDGTSSSSSVDAVADSTVESSSPIPISPAIIIATQLGDTEEVLRLLSEDKIDVNQQDLLGDSALHCARTNRLINILIEKGASVNIKNSLGSTPLHKAAQRGDRDVVSLLLRHKADPTIRNNNGLLAKQLTSIRSIRMMLFQSRRAGKTIEIPNSKHKFIVGVKGATMRSIEMESGTIVTLPDRSELSDQVLITGEDEESLLTAQKLILSAAYPPKSSLGTAEGAIGNFRLTYKLSKVQLNRLLRSFFFLRRLKEDDEVSLIIPLENDESNTVLTIVAETEEKGLRGKTLVEDFLATPEQKPYQKTAGGGKSGSTGGGRGGSTRDNRGRSAGGERGGSTTVNRGRSAGGERVGQAGGERDESTRGNRDGSTRGNSSGPTRGNKAKKQVLSVNNFILK